MTKICNYCGQYQEFDEDKFCECGGKFISSGDNFEYYSWERKKVIAKRQNDFYWGGDIKYNNIDNILESKRR